MSSLLVQLLPIFFYFAVGVLVKRAGLGDKTHGEFLLRFVFFVTLPLLILTSMPNISLSGDKALLPLVNVVVNAVCAGLMFTLARLQGVSRRDIGTAVVNTGIHNNSFMFPFILAVLGQAGFADAILLDLGNSLWMATVVYLLAFYFGGAQHNRWAMLQRIAKSPLIWSLIISLALVFTQHKLPALITTVITPMAQMTAPLILVALGMYFSFNITQVGLALQIVGVRMVVGGLTGWLLATLLGLEGTTRTVVIVCSAAPIGFNALTYSSLAKLNTELSASAVSIAIVSGLIGIPILLFLLTP
jgi:malate permease and related proteins